ncbi:MAG: hypothetical protein WCP97_08490 [bacterium]
MTRSKNIRSESISKQQQLINELRARNGVMNRSEIIPEFTGKNRNIAQLICRARRLLKVENNGKRLAAVGFTREDSNYSVVANAQQIIDGNLELFKRNCRAMREYGNTFIDENSLRDIVASNLKLLAVAGPLLDAKICLLDGVTPDPRVALQNKLAATMEMLLNTVWSRTPDEKRVFIAAMTRINRTNTKRKATDGATEDGEPPLTFNYDIPGQERLAFMLATALTVRLNDRELCVVLCSLTGEDITGRVDKAMGSFAKSKNGMKTGLEEMQKVSKEGNSPIATMQR